MDWLMYLCCAVLGYLIGNIQFAVIISRMKYKDDVRNHGSGNAGSTNMLRVFGLKPGLITFFGDFLKGVLGVVLGRLVAGEYGGYIAALFVVLGHDFPAFLGFRGGKGVAATFGSIWTIAPLYGLITTLTAIVIMALTKTISKVSILSATACLITALVADWGNIPRILLVVALWALILIRHGENIRRILHGEESKLFGVKK